MDETAECAIAPEEPVAAVAAPEPEKPKVIPKTFMEISTVDGTFKNPEAHKEVTRNRIARILMETDEFMKIIQGATGHSDKKNDEDWVRQKFEAISNIGHPKLQRSCFMPFCFHRHFSYCFPLVTMKTDANLELLLGWGNDGTGGTGRLMLSAFTKSKATIETLGETSIEQAMFDWSDLQMLFSTIGMQDILPIVARPKSVHGIHAYDRGTETTNMEIRGNNRQNVEIPTIKEILTTPLVFQPTVQF